MTKEEWEKAKEALESLFSGVALNVDGYEITLKLVRISAYKNAIAVYIAGVFKGEWLTKDCEERRRFFQRKERSLLSTKEKQNFKKLPKKEQKILMERYHNLNYECFSSHWTAFGSLKKHLIQNNKNIELIKIY